MTIDSKIFMDEKVSNADRKFGSATEYYPVWVQLEDGAWAPAAFTHYELTVAMERGANNKEDIPLRTTPVLLRLWYSLTSWF